LGISIGRTLLKARTSIMVTTKEGPRGYVAFIRRNITPRRVLITIGQLWAVPILIIVRLLRPLIVIRMGLLHSQFIGHYAGDLEIYLCERDSGINWQKRYIDLWFNQTNIISNKHVEKMWKRQLIILPRALLAPVYLLNRLIPCGKIHQIGSTFHDRDVNNLLHTQPQHASFTEEEEDMGQRLLSEMGIPEGAPFVCLNVRDAAFHSQSQFTNYRNADVGRCMLAAEELTERGFHVVRIGKKVEHKFESGNKKILDYASSAFRSDFMDIYLGAKCVFVISSSTGWDSIPCILFRRPVLYINFVPISLVATWNYNTLAIFKRHWFPSQKRFLTQSEIFYLIDRDFVTKFPLFDELGVELVDNTAEEIRDATLEMADMLRSEGPKQTNEEMKMQDSFWSLYTRNLQRFDLRHLHGDINLHGDIRVRIGAKFLATNPEFSHDIIDSAISCLRPSNERFIPDLPLTPTRPDI
jgi:putative glycosyltransferase (TIGR04372 family)